MFYENLPKITEFNPDELSNSFMLSSFKKKPEMDRVARPYSINISKQDIDSVLSDGTVGSSVMAFFVNYIRNAVTLFKYDRPGYILAFKVSNFSKFDKTATFEYLETLSNLYKWNTSEVLTKGITLFIVFFYDGRWILAIFDPKAEKCMLVDFLARSLTKVSNDELHDIVKSYLHQEFDFKSNSITFYDKYRSDVYNNCGVFVCSFLTEYFINSIDYDRITVTENEKDVSKKVIAWLIVKVDQLKRPGEKEPPLEHHSLDKILPPNLEDRSPKAYARRPTMAASKSPTNIYSRPSQMPAFSYAPDEIKKPETIKMTKADLANILNKVKEDVIDEDSDSEIDFSDMLGQEGLFEGSEDSQEILSKSRIKKLLKRVEKKKQKQKNKKSNKPLTYEEYAEQMFQYQQEMNELYSMLNYFQQSNPKLYLKIAKDLNSQLEDKLLEKFNLMHLKYPNQRSQHNTLLPSIFGHQKSNSMSNPRFSIAQPAFSNQPRFSIAQPAFSNAQQPRFSIAPPKMSIMKPRGSIIANTNNNSDEPMLTPHKKLTIVEPKPTSASTNDSKSISRSEPSSAINTGRKGSGPQLLPDTPSSRPSSFGFNAKGDELWSPSGAFGAGNLSRNGNFGSDNNNPRNQIMAKRYNIKISRFHFQKLKNENLLFVEVLNFFLGYLREKQTYMPPNKIKNFQSNILYFGPEFYQSLTDGGKFVKLSQYENVKDWTSSFKGIGKTIFDVLDKVVIIVKLTNEHHVLVCISNNDKKLFLFDPSRPKDKSASENEILLNIIQYMDFEYQDKTQKRFDLAKWQMIYGDISRVNDIRESGLAVAKLAHNIQRGMLQAQLSEEVMGQFKRDLLDLILRIGITAGQNEDMKWIANHKI